MIRQAGFTLVEVLLAVAIGAMAMTAVGTVLVTTMETHAEIDSLTSSNAEAQRVLTLIERDLKGLWHHDIDRNQVLVGRPLDISGTPADRIDLLTSTDAIGGVVDNQMTLSHPSICEVGYWIKEHPTAGELLELWRREDPMVDDDLLSGGQFQLVTNRLRSFKINYYETLGYEAEEFDEWDSGFEGKLPRRIRIEFTFERKVGNRNEVRGNEIRDIEKVKKTYVRHIVFDKRYPDILQAGVAMLPIAPMPPSAAGEGDGPLGPAGDGGQGGESGSGGGSGGSGGGNGGTPARPGDSGQGTRPSQPPSNGQPPGSGQPPPDFDLGDLLRGGGKGSGQDWFGGR